MDEEVRKTLQEHSQRLNSLESEMDHGKREDIKRDQQYNEMMAILLEIRSRIDKQDGAREGATTMVKVFWAVFGSLVIATILGVSSLLWTLNAKIAVLENALKIHQE